MQIKSDVVTARGRVLNTSWSIDLEQDMATMMGEEIRAEIDDMIIRDMCKTQYKVILVFTGSFVSETLNEAVQQAREYINMNGKIRTPVIASLVAALQIEKLCDTDLFTLRMLGYDI